MMFSQEQRDQTEQNINGIISVTEGNSSATNNSRGLLGTSVVNSDVGHGDLNSTDKSDELPDESWIKAAAILLSLKNSSEARMTGGRNTPGIYYSIWTPCFPSETERDMNSTPSEHNSASYYHSNGFHLKTEEVVGEEKASSSRNIQQTMDRGLEDDETDKDSTTTCSLCHKVYSRPSTLKAHMRIHTGEKPFQCNICDKSFSQDANLKAHLRVHSKEKPFKCQVCQRRFAQSSSVTTHMRIHSGERPYKCQICSRGFADSSTLTKHLRIHTGEKPYQCKVCEMRFSQSGNLSRHMRVHKRKI